MTARKHVGPQPLPPQGLLTSDSEWAAQQKQKDIEILCAVLAADDSFDLEGLKALAAAPETQDVLGWQIALFLARRRWPERFKVPPARDVVWHQGLLHNLAADFLFEKTRDSGSERTIIARLRSLPEYDPRRWSQWAEETLRERLHEALQQPLVRAALNDKSGRLLKHFIGTCALLGAAG